MICRPYPGPPDAVLHTRPVALGQGMHSRLDEVPPARCHVETVARADQLIAGRDDGRVLLPGVHERETAELAGCIDTLAAVHEAGGYPSNWPTDPARWLTPSGMHRAWVCRSEDAGITGHVLVSRVRGRWPGAADNHDVFEVCRLFVSPLARRQGIASRLLQQTRLWATGHRCDLVLEVADHLAPAQALYERMGWERTGTVLSNWLTPDRRRVPLMRYALCCDQM